MFGIISEQINVIDIRTMSHRGQVCGCGKGWEFQVRCIHFHCHFAYHYILHVDCWSECMTHITGYQCRFAVSIWSRHTECAWNFLHTTELEAILNIGYIQSRLYRLKFLLKVFLGVCMCSLFSSQYYSFTLIFVDRSFIYFSSHDIYKWPDNNGNEKVLLTTATLFIGQWSMFNGHLMKSTLTNN